MLNDITKVPIGFMIDLMVMIYRRTNSANEHFWKVASQMQIIIINWIIIMFQLMNIT